MKVSPQMNVPADIQVWDPLVRLLHWALVAAFFIAYFTEDEWLNWHIVAGYTVLGLVLLRVIWGFVGTSTARFSNFVHSPGETLSYIIDVFTGRSTRYVGHNPAGGAMIVALLLFLLATTITGLMLYGADAWRGPLAELMKNTSDENIDLIKEIHEFCANFTLFLVIVHVLGVIWESVLHRENLVLSMFHGRKRP